MMPCSVLGSSDTYTIEYRAVHSARGSRLRSGDTAVVGLVRRHGAMLHQRLVHTPVDTTALAASIARMRPESPRESPHPLPPLTPSKSTASSSSSARDEREGETRRPRTAGNWWRSPRSQTDTGASVNDAPMMEVCGSAVGSPMPPRREPYRRESIRTAHNRRRTHFSEARTQMNVAHRPWTHESNSMRNRQWTRGWNHEEAMASPQSVPYM